MIWGAKGYRSPLSKCDPQTNVIAFHQELWERRNGTSLLLRAIQQRAVERCFLLLKGPVDYEIARSLVELMYRRDESFVTSDFEWLVYSSHESSIAVGGMVSRFVSETMARLGSRDLWQPLFTSRKRFRDISSGIAVRICRSLIAYVFSSWELGISRQLDIGRKPGTSPHITELTHMALLSDHCAV